jgi:hypothetical protein
MDGRPFMDRFAPKNDHHACKSREGDGDLCGCAENFARFHGNSVCSAKCDVMRRKALRLFEIAPFVRASQSRCQRHRKRESVHRVNDCRTLRGGTS